MMTKDVITNGCAGSPINPAPGDPHRSAGSRPPNEGRMEQTPTGLLIRPSLAQE